MNYRIRYTTEAAKSLKSMPGRFRQRARRIIESLANHPVPSGAKELRGLAGRYRIRLNGWRIIYKVETEGTQILILAVRQKTGPETYSGLK